VTIVFWLVEEDDMRTLTAEMHDTKVREIIHAAQGEPVTVLEDGKPAAIVLSPIEFARLSEQDVVRREAKARLRQTIAAMHKDATARGLTDAEAERLLADDER
jgi:PHD/YefM family antitoxin component YafN of YafNO toxin-antitoxin module